MKPPKTRVLDINDVVRNQIDVLEHRNGVKLPKNFILDLKKCIEISHVVCLESYYYETSIKCTPIIVSAMGRVRRRNGMKPPMSFGPKVADWACPLLENQKWFWRHKLVH